MADTNENRRRDLAWELALLAFPLLDDDTKSAGPRMKCFYGILDACRPVASEPAQPLFSITAKDCVCEYDTDEDGAICIRENCPCPYCWHHHGTCGFGLLPRDRFIDINDGRVLGAGRSPVAPAAQSKDDAPIACCWCGQGDEDHDTCRRAVEFERKRASTPPRVREPHRPTIAVVPCPNEYAGKFHILVDGEHLKLDVPATAPFCKSESAAHEKARELAAPSRVTRE